MVHARGGLSDTYVIEGVREVPAGTAGIYQPVLTRPKDTRFNSTVPARVELKRTPSGHLFVRPKINSKEVGWFALDTGTGGGLTIAPAVAEALKMPAFGKVVYRGAGKEGKGTLRQGTTFELGPLTITGSIYLDLNPEFVESIKKHFGLEMVGTCGYDLFSRSVVELDGKGQTCL